MKDVSYLSPSHISHPPSIVPNTQNPLLRLANWTPSRTAIATLPYPSAQLSAAQSFDRANTWHPAHPMLATLCPGWLLPKPTVSRYFEISSSDVSWSCCFYCFLRLLAAKIKIKRKQFWLRNCLFLQTKVFQ